MTIPKGHSLVRGLAGLFIFSFTVFLASGALAQSPANSQKVTVEGIEAITGNNQMIARDKALDQALRAAVEQVAGTIVSSETLVENFQLVNDTVYTKAKGYVQGYEIVQEGPAGDGTYKVVVSAVVSKKLLADSLRDIVEGVMQTSHKPRTLFMIAEQQIGKENWQAWWTELGAAPGGTVATVLQLNTTENSFQKIFSDNGFPVVDLAAAAKDIKISNAYSASDLTDRQVKELGTDLHAEMILYGQAVAALGDKVLGSPVYSIPVNLSVRVVSADTGKVIASASTSCTHLHAIPDVGGPEALRKCAKKVADEIMPKMVESITQDHSVQLFVSYSTYKDLVDFKQFLKQEIRTVQNVHQRATAKGSSNLELDMKSGTAENLADELSVHRFSGFSIEVTEVTHNTIKIKLARQAASAK